MTRLGPAGFSRAPRPPFRTALGSILLPVMFAAGCATAGSVRELGEAEQQMFAALDQRLEENETMVRKTATQLGALGVDYVRKEYELELSLSKAKLLDAMRAPWASPRSEFAPTQRAVVLYHLYQLELAEDEVLEARIRERRARAREVLVAYRRLQSLLAGASDNLELVLEYLNQPTGAQISEYTANFLAEVTAFRLELQESDNPRLRELADEVETYEEAARKAREEAEMALDAILKLSE